MVRRTLRTIPAAGLAIAGVLSISVALQAQDERPRIATLLRISEIRQGTYASQEICTIVYLDGEFRTERIFHRRGDTDTMQESQGRLGSVEINQLFKILHSPEFLQLESPKLIRRLVEENFHGLYISVPRPRGVQDLSYPTKASRKSSGVALKPLLEWWQQLRQNPARSVDLAKRTRCAPGASQ